MSVINFAFLARPNIFRNFLKGNTSRIFSLNTTNYSTEEPPEVQEAPETVTREPSEKEKARDRTKVIPVETGIRYLKSAAYKETYGEYLVWEQYRRNHKGMFPPRKTRKTCIRKGMLSTGNPCPVCRDEYLVLDYRNVDLLKQFISPQSGEVISYSKTGVCQKRHQELLISVERARDFGYLTFDVPFREYDYSEYYNEKNESKK